MGCSAKLHKRVKKAVSSASSTQTSKNTISLPPKVSNTSNTQASSKKRAGLKEKAANTKSLPRDAQGRVLGGVDYVNLMMGGRRRAREEAEKLRANQN